MRRKEQLSAGSSLLFENAWTLLYTFSDTRSISNNNLRVTVLISSADILKGKILRRKIRDDGKYGNEVTQKVNRKKLTVVNNQLAAALGRLSGLQYREFM